MSKEWNSITQVHLLNDTVFHLVWWGQGLFGRTIARGQGLQVQNPEILIRPRSRQSFLYVFSLTHISSDLFLSIGNGVSNSALPSWISPSFSIHLYIFCRIKRARHGCCVCAELRSHWFRLCFNAVVTWGEFSIENFACLRLILLCRRVVTWFFARIFLPLIIIVCVMRKSFW